MTLVTRAGRARLVAGTAVACLAMLVAACGTGAGSSAPSAGSSPATPAVSAPGSADGAGSSASPAPARTLTAPPAFGTTNGIYPCPAAFVKVTLGLSQRTKTVTYQVIEFTNRGDKLCSLGGYPGVSLAGGEPLAQIGLAAAWPSGNSPRPVSLNPGQSANSLLQISHASNYSEATCDPVRAPYLVIAVPNDIGFVKLAYRTTACAKPIEILSISSIVLGTGS